MSYISNKLMRWFAQVAPARSKTTTMPPAPKAPKDAVADPAVILAEGFEEPWGGSHLCHVFPEDGGTPHFKNIGNIFVPPNWTFWFRHKAGVFAQPEARDAHKTHDPTRVHSGEKAFVCFTFFKRHEAGLYRRVEVEPGTPLRLTAWAHAWSNTNIPGHEDCLDRGGCSAGVGTGPFFLLEDEAPQATGDPWEDARLNILFEIGIDPTGGVDPFADTVVWGEGAYIYNAYAEVPFVEAVAESDMVTVFLSSYTEWPFKHNDAYWDDVELEVTRMYGSRHSPEAPLAGQAMTIEGLAHEQVQTDLVVRHESGNLVEVEFQEEYEIEAWFRYVRAWVSEPVLWTGRYTMEFYLGDTLIDEADFHIPDGVEAPDPDPDPPPPPPPPDGLPRDQYDRTYVLLPPGAGPEWAHAVIDGSWEANRFTVGGSADDAGLGALYYKRVIAVNEDLWPGGLALSDFFQQYYPGVEYIALEADTPEELAGIFRLASFLEDESG